MSRSERRPPVVEHRRTPNHHTTSGVAQWLSCILAVPAMGAVFQQAIETGEALRRFKGPGRLLISSPTLAQRASCAIPTLIPVRRVEQSAIARKVSAPKSTGRSGY